MISLTGSSRLPLVRLARTGGKDLVFRGEMLAYEEAVLQTCHARRHVTMSLYKSQTGKFILSLSEQPPSCREIPAALCFSCLSDVWEYLGTEYPGLETMLVPYLSRTSFPPYAQERFSEVHRTFTQNCTRDCARCAESCNCAGREHLPADRSHFRRSCP